MTLTKREREVLILLAKGLANKEVAARLKISIHTTFHHRESIYRKLRVNNTGQMICRALDIKVISLQDLGIAPVASSPKPPFSPLT